MKPTIVQLILNATAAGRAMLTAANESAQKALLSLTKSDVGLGNVDNTSDASKPVSSATQAALDAKQATLVSGTNIKTVNSTSLLGSGNLSVGTLGGSVGSTTNRLVKSSGTDTLTVQSTGITVDASNNVSGVGAITASGTATLPIVKTARIDLNPIISVYGFFGSEHFRIGQSLANNIIVSDGFELQFNSQSVSAAITPDGRFLRSGTNQVDIRTGTFRVRSYDNAADAALTAGAITASGDITARDLTASGLMCAGVYTFATIPSASSNSGKFLRISDRAQKHAYSDGVNWRFFGDDAVIS